MASYTMTVQSNELEAIYGRAYSIYSGTSYNSTSEGKYTFDVQGLLGATIKSVSITAPVVSTRQQGGYGNFELKLDSSTLGIWEDSDVTTWGASDLSLEGKSSNTLTLSLGPSNNYHTVSDRYATWGNTGRTLGRATATITFEADFLESTVAPISGETIPRSVANTFSWTPSIFSGTMASQTLYWKNHSDANYTAVSVGANDTSYTFNANTFTNGYIDWFIQGVDSYGNVTYSNIETVGVGITPTVVIDYPNEINITSGSKQIFTWEMIESIATGQFSYIINYKKSTDTNWTTISATTSNQYHEFDANTFSAGTYSWTLTVANNDGLTAQATGTFVAIGSTEAPVITSVSNSSMPVIQWNISSQDSFEVEIYSGNNKVYSSGIQVGVDDGGHLIKRFAPKIILENGNYIIRMRAMNEYGYYTEWIDYSFVLNPTEIPATPNCIVYANAFHGVSIEFTSEEYSTAINHYAMRRAFGDKEWTIVGKFSYYANNNIVTDNTCISGVKYEYAVRSCYSSSFIYGAEGGYSDSDAVEMVIDYKGFLIYNNNDFVQLYMTEDNQFDISHSISKSYADIYMVGRKYPIRESSEWMAQSTSLSCFVTLDEYQKLIEFFEGDNLLWFKGKDFSFRCAIDSINIKETLLGKGYTLNISLSRMDEDEVIL